jgi:hypothetical protein
MADGSSLAFFDLGDGRRRTFAEHALDHDGWVKSIYFFDPNGARLELTTITAGPEKLAEYRAKARADLDAWTRAKRQGKKT